MWGDENTFSKETKTRVGRLSDGFSKGQEGTAVPLLSLAAASLFPISLLSAPLFSPSFHFLCVYSVIFFF